MQQVRSQDLFGVDPTVFILESLSPQEMKDGVSEAAELEAALHAQAIGAHRFDAHSSTQFDETFPAIAELIVARRGDGGKPIVPKIHISSHGHAAGILLADDVLIPWSKLRSNLIGLGTTAKIANLEDVLQISLSMSTCHGIHALEMFKLGPPFPCVGVVGPRDTVDWYDAKVAFTRFFLETLRKDVLIPDAVALMNEAVGAESFGLFVSDEVRVRQIVSLKKRLGKGL